jgi:CubicO group peptidase (beta-lactamase class C family)
MKRTLLILLIATCAAIGNAQSDKTTPSFITDSLDIYVNRGIAEWQVPGLAVCVVKDGKVVLMKGYGTRELGGTDKVDENTLFMIGSNTKAFTATALSLLNDEKKLSLDDKVQKWMPDFKLYDPWVAKEVTIRDLLCHRLGFETFQGDFMYFNSDLTVPQVFDKLGKVKPMYSFRSKWGYCNAAFLAAGEIIPKVTGKSWAQFVTERIFTPLGMDRTLALSKDIATATNKATAHSIVEGQIKKVPYGKIDNLAPAGSISSSVNDMSKWVMMQLGNGKLDGKEIMDRGVLAETYLPASILGNGGHRYNSSHFYLYGLGWFLQEYSGRKIVSHTGGVNGFVTGVTLVPEENLGIIVLTNTDGNNFFESLKWEILDSYLKLPYRNYSKDMLAGAKKGEQQDEQELNKTKEIIAKNPKTSLPLQSYAGTYRHNVYGKMTIAVENKKLVARFEHHNGLRAELNALGGDDFWTVFSDPLYGQKKWPFKIENKKVKSVTVTVADFVEFTPYEFIKIN